MSILKIYLKPFDDLGVYTSFIDITSDVNLNSMSRLSQKLDNNQFDVGIFKFGDISLSLRNDHGKYSEVGSSATVFKYKRSGSILKITWSYINRPAICGFAVCGLDAIQEEVALFEGILNDENTSSDADTQETNFQILSYESLLDKMETPYASISNGQTISTVLYTLLNQTLLTDLVTVDSGNISCSINGTIDDKTDLENTTVKESCNRLLEASNSVLFIDSANVLYVTPRTPSATSLATFYGPAAVDGIQNVVKITSLRNGLNKMFNYWTWKNTAYLSTDSTSSTKYGVRKKEIGTPLFTGATDINAILANALAEFKLPKQEFELTTTMTPITIDLFLLDKVTVDYPAIYFSARDQDIPLYGLSIYGSAYYPIVNMGITISNLVEYKIMGRVVDLKSQLITFNIREV